MELIDIVLSKDWQMEPNPVLVMEVSVRSIFLKFLFATIALANTMAALSAVALYERFSFSIVHVETFKSLAINSQPFWPMLLCLKSSSLCANAGFSRNIKMIPSNF